MFIGWLRQVLVLAVMSASLILVYYALAFWFWLARLFRRLDRPSL